LAKLGKAARVAERKRSRNKPVRSTPKTTIDAAEKLLASKDVEGAGKKYKEAQSSLDRAVKTGVLKLNNAARRKSRLTKKINAAKAPAPKA